MIVLYWLKMRGYANVWFQNLTDGRSKVKSTESSKGVGVQCIHHFLLVYVLLNSRCFVNYVRCSGRVECAFCELGDV